MSIENEEPVRSLVVSAELQNYWYEYITREEALRRLAGRPLDEATRTSIAQAIPDRTFHALTFHGGAFREYADFGTGIARVLLILPIIENDDGTKYQLIAPVYLSEVRADGKIIQAQGIELHQYESRDGCLYENGIAKREFQFADGPKPIRIDVSFAVSNIGLKVGPASCCKACDWVHSVFDIHNLDRICCMGACGPIHSNGKVFF